MDGFTDNLPPKASCAVILGSKVYDDGSLSPRLVARLQKGLELYNNGVVSHLMVSGGTGKEGIPEGTAMAGFLMDHNVPISAITIDNLGNTTHLTAINYFNQFPNNQSVIVVSQYFHITRTKLAFRQIGNQTVHGAHADFFSKRDAYSIAREIAGLYKYLLVYS